jgi:methylglyoxal synthase
MRLLLFCNDSNDKNSLGDGVAGEVERRKFTMDNFDKIPDETFNVQDPDLLQMYPGTIAHKRIALVAHDNKKQDLLEWACFNRDLLVQHDLFATGTTGKLLSANLDAPITSMQSGPLGGDQQIGARIADGGIDLLIFFWDPLSPQPHDPDVKALLRIAVVWNIPVACDRATADFVISSPLMREAYQRMQPDYTNHVQRLEASEEMKSMVVGD